MITKQSNTKKTIVVGVFIRNSSIWGVHSSAKDHLLFTNLRVFKEAELSDTSYGSLIFRERWLDCNRSSTV
ncbi:unnamed protein product [Arabis nemorensis]|uniref:Uncharacterized protein n=1 Tax=Arabis nemorensis TaxID=586526 RepID=A0A565BG25_9BRAS|nr:unnamed protein product [Arabis nemorensis]